MGPERVEVQLRLLILLTFMWIDRWIHFLAFSLGEFFWVSTCPAHPPYFKKNTNNKHQSNTVTGWFQFIQAWKTLHVFISVTWHGEALEVGSVQKTYSQMMISSLGCVSHEILVIILCCKCKYLPAFLLHLLPTYTLFISFLLSHQANATVSNSCYWWHAGHLLKLGSDYMSFGSILFAPPNHQRRKLLRDCAQYWRLAQIIW